MATDTDLVKCIEAHLNEEAVQAGGEVVERGLDSLPTLRDFLTRDLPISQTERLEGLLKAILRAAMSRPVTGRDARRIAQFQKDVGFLLKYKSYAIKAATPVGYSVFLQREREGFSFQRHVEHKLEVFHILRVKPGGYIFLCDFDEWKRIYRKDLFESWMRGGSNADYERFKFVPEPGDVFIISELGVVHTVMGCVLEEYATVSTDMVERLHDQNEGKKIPPEFNRKRAEPELRAVESPASYRLVSGLGKKTIEPIGRERVEGGERVILCDSFVRAARYLIEPGKRSAVGYDDRRSALLRMNSGRGSVSIAEESECRGTMPALTFETGDLFLIPPGIRYAVHGDGGDQVSYSEHLIAPEVAFI